MRPIFWGLICFLIGMVGWIAFSVIGGLGEGITGEADPTFKALVSFFGMIFFFSLPVAIIFEIIRWARKRKRRKREGELNLKN
ncbi:MAG: hypothetical protein ACKKMS_02540 [Candidatus Nealsonbacteria bacterium]